jgi:uncharacterized protein (DUF433 family)
LDSTDPVQIRRAALIYLCYDDVIGRIAMSKRQNLIEVDPEKLGGTPVFYGTRVPIKNLFDCLEDGETLDEFLDQFPTVTREQALAILEASKASLILSHESAA